MEILVRVLWYLMDSEDERCSVPLSLNSENSGSSAIVYSSDPSPLERLTQKYTRKDYSLYDLRLQSLRPEQYFRAATTDRRNAIFMISEHKEQELVAAGQLTKENLKQLLEKASRTLDREETGSRRLVL